MEFYAGIDLHSRKSQVAVIDSHIETLINQSVSNDLAAILEILGRFDAKPRIVVESTFNWYWLVDGLQEAGYDVTLAHTLALSLITKSKVKTDRRDAVCLARLLRIGEIPRGKAFATEQIAKLRRRRTTGRAPSS